jgi:hypothetical protein
VKSVLKGSSGSKSTKGAEPKRDGKMEPYMVLKLKSFDWETCLGSGKSIAKSHTICQKILTNQEWTWYYTYHAHFDHRGVEHYLSGPRNSHLPKAEGHRPRRVQELALAILTAGEPHHYSLCDAFGAWSDCS